MLKELAPYLVSIITALASGIGAYFMSGKKFKQELQTLKTNNELDINKLIKQHEINIEAIKEKHKLEMDAKEREHKYNLEILQEKAKNEILIKQKELEGSAMYGSMGKIMENAVSGNTDGILNLINLKKQFSKFSDK